MHFCEVVVEYREDKIKLLQMHQKIWKPKLLKCHNSGCVSPPVLVCNVTSSGCARTSRPGCSPRCWAPRVAGIAQRCHGSPPVTAPACTGAQEVWLGRKRALPLDGGLSWARAWLLRGFWGLAVSLNSLCCQAGVRLWHVEGCSKAFV